MLNISNRAYVCLNLDNVDIESVAFDDRHFSPI